MFMETFYYLLFIILGTYQSFSSVAIVLILSYIFKAEQV